MSKGHGMIFKFLAVTALLLLAFSGQVFAQDLETPVLSSPGHGQVVAGETVELQWEAQEAADWYAVAVWILSDGQFEYYWENETELITENSLTNEGLSDEGDIFAWTVAASDSQAGV